MWFSFQKHDTPYILSASNDATACCRPWHAATDVKRTHWFMLGFGALVCLLPGRPEPQNDETTTRVEHCSRVLPVPFSAKLPRPDSGPMGAWPFLLAGPSPFEHFPFDAHGCCFANNGVVKAQSPNLNSARQAIAVWRVSLGCISKGDLNGDNLFGGLGSFAKRVGLVGMVPLKSCRHSPTLKIDMQVCSFLRGAVLCSFEPKRRN